MNAQEREGYIYELREMIDRLLVANGEECVEPTEDQEESGATPGCTCVYCDAVRLLSVGG